MGNKTRGKSAGRREAIASCTAGDHIDQHEYDIFGLGYDVALHILLLLPLKSLFVLKCVSKQCLAVISDPVFARRKSASVDSISGLLKLYFGFSIRPEQFLFIPDRMSEKATALNEAMTSMKVDGKGVRILDSHKGLLLCCEDGSRGKGKVKHYFVCNTLTDYYVSFPITSKMSRSYKVAKLIFEEDQFCFKIIQISMGKERLALHTFSLEGGKRKVSKMALPLSNGDCPTGPLTLLGKSLFWLSTLRDILGAYNMEEKRCYELPLPMDRNGAGILARCLCASVGALYYAERTHGYSSLTIWVQIDNKDDHFGGIAKDVTWVMTHTIDMEPLFKAHNFINWEEYTPLAIHSSNPNLLFLKIGWKFVVLDMNDKNKLTLVCDQLAHNLDDDRNGFFYNWACPFEEPVWMLTLSSLPLLFRQNISRLARYMITCY